MLTRQHAISEFDFANGRIHPDRLTRVADAPYLAISQAVLEVYRNGVGFTRRQLHQRVESLFEQVPDCPSRRISAFIKLLDDESEFERDRNRKSAKLRREVFRAAARHHPLVNQADQIFGSDQRMIKKQIADGRKTTWREIEDRLFADIIEFHRLTSFPGYGDPEDLLSRYNVAQIQACLYRATRMTIWARDDLKTIVRSIKLSRLMHCIRRTGEGQYQFTLDGPASALRQSRRYGVAMARMIPVILSCRNWHLVAPIEIGRSGHRLALHLSSEDGLRSSKTSPSGFDSGVEQDLLEKWNKSEVAGWTLTRESELLHSGQKVFTPDFVATHVSGQQVFVEIIGFWTPEYLSAKVETLNHFRTSPILIIVQENKKTEFETLGARSGSMLTYKTAISISQFCDRLNEMVET